MLLNLCKFHDVSFFVKIYFTNIANITDSEMLTEKIRKMFFTKCA